MATIAQIDANRANAQLSTGPKSTEATRHNATKHGLTGKQIVIKGEDPAEYDALRAGLIADHAPANEREAMLVEEIAQNWWRLQRARRIEAQIIDQLGDVAIILDPDAAKAHQRVTRYLNSIERSWRKACTELDRLQAARRQKEVEAAEASAFLPAFGFVSSNLGAAAPTPLPAFPTHPRLNR